MISFPNCKINLGLWVTERLLDGYHGIQSIMYPIPWTDALEIVPSKSLETTFTVTGERIDGPLDKNLCYRAWHLMSDIYKIPPVSMHLHKNLPTGAGLGGGSSDASFTLKMLNDLFMMKLDNDTLRSLSKKLGMDCPFFIDNVPAFASGRGEIVKPIELNLDGYYIYVVKPPISVGTVDAYSGIKAKQRSMSMEGLASLPVYEWKGVLTNDFEKSVLGCYSEIGDIKKTMYDRGAVFAAMTGTGSAVFGLFEEEPITLEFPECRVFKTLLGSHSQ